MSFDEANEAVDNLGPSKLVKEVLDIKTERNFVNNKQNGSSLKAYNRWVSYENKKNAKINLRQSMLSRNIYNNSLEHKSVKKVSVTVDDQRTTRD